VLFQELWRMAPFWGERIIYPRSANSFWGLALRRVSTQEQAMYKHCDHLECVAFVKPIAVCQKHVLTSVWCVTASACRASQGKVRRDVSGRLSDERGK
jgi:hypothetical protein